MHPLYLLVILSVATLTLSGCGADEVAVEPPSDLALVYTWREGSLPPPYHYEYTISLQPDGAGELVFEPGYSGGATPVWTEPFTVSVDQRASLYTLLRDKGVLSREWPPSPELSVGGSTEWLQVTAGGKQVQIPPQLQPADTTAMEPVYASINRLVPADLWARVRQQHQEYEDSQQP
ncbi:MAG: hypothetical protein H0T53_18160 [Herpetosiphonaceae bacterium]|nr:hypothetical protein [Herpetosiphonaceae bacterium]